MVQAVSVRKHRSTGGTIAALVLLVLGIILLVLTELFLESALTVYMDYVAPATLILGIIMFVMAALFLGGKMWGSLEERKTNVTTKVVGTKSKGLAVFLSFLLPGLGQLYVGNSSGIILICLYFVFLFLGFYIGSLGFIPFIILWIYGMYNAYKLTEANNNKVFEQETDQNMEMERLKAENAKLQKQIKKAVNDRKDNKNFPSS